MNTYTLSIGGITGYPANSAQNANYRIYWTYSGTDGTSVASIQGRTDLAYTAGNPLAAFAQLTSAQVQGCVTASWSASDLAGYQAQLDGMIVAQKAAPALPWGS